MYLTVPRLAPLRLLCLALAAMISTASGMAAEPLAWKFREGGLHRYKMTQKMALSMKVDDQQIDSQVDQDVYMSWRVREVKEDGSAVLEQQLDRMKMHVEAPGQSWDLDSASSEEPEGATAKKVAPLLKAITGAEFTVTMTPLGKITEVEVPEVFLKSLQNAPGAEMLGGLTSENGIKNLAKQGALTLPEELSEGKTWSQTVDVKNPLFGTQKVVTTYRYVGSRQLDGMTMEVFEPSIQMSFAGEAGPGGAEIKIVDQASSGEILFNREEGRLQQATIKQDVKLQITAGGQQIDQALEQRIRMEWMPGGE